ncbi:exodeoxyribonuclease V subunit beta [Ferrovum myxofaciens]|uniref:exodeoxyribonuclease V subunit beta n=1 Tax=Ferrovum myxofaciens TaxID=416213 RepID=UPI0004E231FE|nr:exodeoxyribonuclease V subunit beta [Ferrovum myxofaciens]
MSDPLDPLTFPLWGSRLIEASAGTGKTWTLAALYVRLVLGHGTANHAPPGAFLPEQILVMTFTRAATRELSERIRVRLEEAAACFRGDSLPTDDFLRSLLDDYPESSTRRRAAWRLTLASQAMEGAAIHTLDAWCQQVLQDTTFAHGQWFPAQITDNDEDLIPAALQDLWRQRLYPLSGLEFRVFLEDWKDFSRFSQRIQKDLPKNTLPLWSTESVSINAIAWTEKHHAMTHELKTLRTLWRPRIEILCAWLDGQLPPSQPDTPFNQKTFKGETVRQWCARLLHWCEENGPTDPCLTEDQWDKLTPNGLQAQVKKNFQIDPPALFDELHDFRTALQNLKDQRKHLHDLMVEGVALRLAQHKAQVLRQNFTDIQQRLDQALQGPQGEALVTSLRLRYPVALIDEFQDTSMRQLRMLDRIYDLNANASERGIFLIGDPKQSIYGFRDADIQSYLKARASVAPRHYLLTTNHRSVAPVVELINVLFEGAEQRVGPGAFRFRAKDDAPLPFHPVQARGRDEQLLCDGRPQPALTVAWTTEPDNRGQLFERMAEHCAEHLGRLLTSAAGFYTSGLQALLRPADLAILVRDRHEAAAVKSALERRNIPSVYLSDRSHLLDSAETPDILLWLQSVAHPRNPRLLRAALGTSTLGFSLAELEQWARSETAFEEILNFWMELHHCWQRQGVLSMLQRLLHHFFLPARWLQEKDGERRLTQVLHLAEFLQRTSAHLEGPEALIQWLIHELQTPTSSPEELRLESDADRVRIITIHKAKGLEFPVVYLPFATCFKPQPEAEEKRLQEDIRLLYVALTRAQHALWIGVSPFKYKTSGPLFSASALGWLLGATPGAPAEELLPLLQETWKSLPEVHFTEASLPLSVTGFIPPPAPALRPASLVTGPFDRAWAIHSFSSLTRSLAFVLPDSPTAQQNSPLPGTSPRHRFPRGAWAGKFLHEQLAWAAERRFTFDTDPTLNLQLHQRCLRQGWETHAADLEQWLQEIALTPIAPSGVALRALPHTFQEMEFWFPLQPTHTEELDDFCQTRFWPGHPRPPLTARTLKGLMMGFADLVFLWEDRFWVLDYKSNALGENDAAYTRTALKQAVLTHRYEVQLALYLLALHRLLKVRLGSTYIPRQHLGGGIDLFLRGIQGPERGSLLLESPHEWIETLDALLTPAFPGISS